jgi:hypothetical protein
MKCFEYGLRIQCYKNFVSSLTAVQNKLECLSTEVLLRGRLSAIDLLLLVLTSLDQHVFILKTLFSFFTKSYLNESTALILPLI